jgi:hypothetical protein
MRNMESALSMALTTLLVGASQAAFAQVKEVSAKLGVEQRVDAIPSSDTSDPNPQGACARPAAEPTSPQSPSPAPPANQTSPPPTPSSEKAFVLRWFELQNATLNLRYHFVDTSAGVVTTNQLQYRATLRGRLKFDKPGRYALNFGVFTGTRFTSGWDNTGWGINNAQKNLAFKTLYFAAQPFAGIEAEVGGLYIVKGESTEFTTYDDDGYITGERVSVRRPKQLFFDEISVTNAYFVGGTGPDNVPVSARLPHIGESNYRQFLVDKKVGKRAAVSADFTLESGRRTWRQAVNVKLPELRVVDSIIFEQYERTNIDAAHGFTISFAKQLTKHLIVNQFGYARIDPKYGPLNADRFNIGNRAFVMATYVFSPEFTASFFITTAVGQNGVLPQRTVSNTTFTYNVLPLLKRTGLF